MPSISFLLAESAAIEVLNGFNWPTWALRITVLLHMIGLKAHIIRGIQS